MRLIPIKATEAENKEFMELPDCRETLSMTINYYDRIGYAPPWIGYYAESDGVLVASAGFKGAPKNGKVEIAYGTFPPYQQQGIATEVCRQLVLISLETDPSVLVTARTLAEENYSTRVLRNNGFELIGTVEDEEDGTVWEWHYPTAKFSV